MVDIINIHWKLAQADIAQLCSFHVSEQKLTIQNLNLSSVPEFICAFSS